MVLLMLMDQSWWSRIYLFIHSLPLSIFLFLSLSLSPPPSLPPSIAFIFLAWLATYQFYWSSQELALGFIDFFFVFLFSVSLISIVIIFSFLLIASGLYCSSFSGCLKWKLRLLMLDLSSFLNIYTFIYDINFPLNTAVIAFHTFL